MYCFAGSFGNGLSAEFPLVYKEQYQAARRVNFLVGKDGKIMEEQVDRDAIDPKKIVDVCARPKLKN